MWLCSCLVVERGRQFTHTFFERLSVESDDALWYLNAILVGANTLRSLISSLTGSTLTECSVLVLLYIFSLASGSCECMFTTCPASAEGHQRIPARSVATLLHQHHANCLSTLRNVGPSHPRPRQAGRGLHCTTPVQAVKCPLTYVRSSSHASTRLRPESMSPVSSIA